MQVSNCCERVPEAVKLDYANKAKDSITFHKYGSRNIW